MYVYTTGSLLIYEKKVNELTIIFLSYIANYSTLLVIFARTGYLLQN
jgi:hypothetical protein